MSNKSDATLAETRNALLELGTTTVHEAAIEGARRGAMDPRIRPLFSGARLCGLAFTVECHPGDNRGLMRALALAEPGQVLVVDGGGVLLGYWGEVLTAIAQQRGIEGLVIDGAVRDVEAIARRRFPVFSAGVSMRGTTKYSRGFLMSDVTCGGIAVRHLDWVVGDEDGVVVVRADNVQRVLAAGAARQANERSLLSRIDSGELSVEDVLGSQVRGSEPELRG